MTNHASDPLEAEIIEEPLRLETAEEAEPPSGRVPGILATIWSALCALGAIGALLAVLGGMWMLFAPATSEYVGGRWGWLLMLLATTVAWGAACVATLRAANKLRTGVRPSLVVPAVLTVLALVLGGIGLQWWQVLHGLLTLGIMVATIVAASKLTNRGTGDIR